jgi:hypothetical protein
VSSVRPSVCATGLVVYSEVGQCCLAQGGRVSGEARSSEQVSISAWKFLQLCFRCIPLVFAKPQHNKRGTNNLPVCFVLLSAYSAHNSFAEISVGLGMNDIRWHIKLLFVESLCRVCVCVIYSSSRRISETDDGG